MHVGKPFLSDKRSPPLVLQAEKFVGEIFPFGRKEISVQSVWQCIQRKASRNTSILGMAYKVEISVITVGILRKSVNPEF